MLNLPKVALVGRANVGKSTLFNTLAGDKTAIVSDIAGTTRDRKYAEITWTNRDFQIIDTGGLDVIHEIAVEKAIWHQAQNAIAEADVVVFVVDLKTGILPQDKEVAKLLRSLKKPVILAANKADTRKFDSQITDFYQLIDKDAPVHLVSGVTGRGTGDLLDEITKSLNKLPKKKKTPTVKPEEAYIKVAIVGKPNVGKSSIINGILGQDRLITAPTPHTTRDSQDIPLHVQGANFTLIDTAGIRKSNTSDRLEIYSVKQAERSIRRADVVVLVTDVSEKLASQDKRLADLINQSSCSVLLVANKWDLIPDKDQNTINKYHKYYEYNFPHLEFAPLLFTSTKAKTRLHKILEVIKTVSLDRQKVISQKQLDLFLEKTLATTPPLRGKGTKRPKIFSLHQVGINPPKFEVVKDYKSDINPAYLKFFIKKIRAEFNFIGSPIILSFRKIH